MSTLSAEAVEGFGKSIGKIADGFDLGNKVDDVGKMLGDAAIELAAPAAKTAEAVIDPAVALAAAKREVDLSKWDMSGAPSARPQAKNLRGRTLEETASNRRAFDVQTSDYDAVQTLKAFQEKKNIPDFEKGLRKQMGLKSDQALDADTIKGHYFDKRNAIEERGTGVADRLSHYKIPQRTAAIGGTAWLVSSLSASKGEQSNAQLYNQQPGGGR